VRCGGWAFRGFARLSSSAGSFSFLDRSFSVRFDVTFRVAADLYAHILYSTRYRYLGSVSCFAVTESLVKVSESPIEPFVDETEDGIDERFVCEIKVRFVKYS
jgi:hypothetical protein